VYEPHGSDVTGKNGRLPKTCGNDQFLVWLSNPRIPSFFRKKVQFKNMAPKKKGIIPFLWAKGSGHLTEHGDGVVFGLHLCEKSISDIARMMSLSRKSVRASIARSRATLGLEVGAAEGSGDEAGTDDERLAPTPQRKTGSGDRLTPKQRELEERRERVDEMMYERTPDDEAYVIRSAHDVRRRRRGSPNGVTADAQQRHCVAWSSMEGGSDSASDEAPPLGEET
jgi:hypothetical protein